MEICLENLSCILANGTPFHKKAIDRISINIPNGQFVAIMGPAGSGKTTLAQAIGGLIVPDSGDLRIGRYRINNKASRRHLWKMVGFLFQFPEHQVFEDTVFKHIAAGLNRSGMRPELMAERVQQAMEAAGLCYAKLKDRSPFQVSGGELRRVALAAILASEPSILILDEPTAGLDGCERDRILSFIKRIHEDKRITVLYITHRLEEALEYSDRILVLDHGKLFADFHPGEIRANWHRLEHIGFVKTPLLRYLDWLEKRFADSLPANIYKEDQLVSFIVSIIRGN
ncbi:ATP-binding cassette domain-containing protein [Paenibacillus piri]|uniref:ATP-binding cassette domain-containing protein n=1 Tax=Paenibacillus piri TaxID=2547395 RepID=A0A4V2ZRU7_9BACL|nr:ATP-binding cassette domain-containing protein [Paenibacillus piri]TDF90094.1 ATP-binding cassette domain-containing protein [Paenibacillus piri]